MAAKCLGDLFRKSCARWPERTAMLLPGKGEFAPVSYAELSERVRGYAAALLDLGVKRGDRVAIQSDNCPEWAFTDWACQTLGAILVPLYPTLPADQSQYIVSDSGAQLLVAGAPEQAAKAEGLSDVRVVLLKGTDDSLDEQAKKTLGNLTIEAWNTSIDATKPEDVATIIYTSGTTGSPKGAMLSHEGFTNLMESILDTLPIDENDRFLCFLPMSHVYERVGGQVLPISTGACIAFAGSLRSLASDMKTFKPTIMLCVPRFLESIRDKVVETASKAPPLRRRLFSFGMDQLVRPCVPYSQPSGPHAKPFAKLCALAWLPNPSNST